jgi:hypothetical protein
VSIIIKGVLFQHTSGDPEVSLIIGLYQSDWIMIPLPFCYRQETFAKQGALREQGTGSRFGCAKRILRPVGPQDASLARWLSEIPRLRLRCSLRSG